MILALTAVLLLIVLLLALPLRDKEQHHLSGLSHSYLSYGDLSSALREVCRGILTPNTLTFLTVNVPAEIITSFGKQQQRLTQYSLRVASDTLVQSLAYRRYERSSLPRRFFGAELSKARGLFLLTLCTVGRMGLGAVRFINWGVPRSVQSWISAKILMSLGTLLGESTSVAGPRFRPPVDQQRETHHVPFMSDGLFSISLDKQIHEALLKALPNDISRMIYIATMRDNNSGHYHYPELTRKFSVDVVDRAMLACHGQLFDRVVRLSLEDLTESLDVYIAGTHVPKARLIRAWKKLRAYRATIPIDSDPISAEVFFMKVEVALAVLEARMPANSCSAE